MQEIIIVSLVVTTKILILSVPSSYTRMVSEVGSELPIALEENCSGGYKHRADYELFDVLC